MSGKNPYTKDELDLPVGKRNILKVEVPEPTEQERLAKWLGTENLEKDSHKWSFIDGEVETSPVTGPLCIGCSQPINSLTSTYAKILVGVIKIKKDVIIEIDHKLLEVRKIIGIPEFKAGFCCKECVDTLYAEKYINSAGEIKRAIELLDHPKDLKVKESYRKGHREVVHSVLPTRAAIQTKDDNLPSGKDEIKRVTTPIYNKRGKEIAADEEWIIGGLASDKVDEPVHVRGYERFTTTRSIGKVKLKPAPQGKSGPVKHIKP